MTKVEAEHMTSVLVIDSLINGTVTSFILLVVALGLALVFGIMHIVNLSHGELMMLGAYILWMVTTWLGLNYVIGVVLAIICIGAFGLLLERLAFRRLAGQFLPSLILSIGLMLSLQVIAMMAFGPEDKGVSGAIPGLISFGNYQISWERFISVVVSAAAVTGLALFTRYTKFGQAMRAVEEDPEAAQLQGISINQTRLSAMGIGAALAGLAGCMLAPIYFVAPSMGGDPMILAFAAIILGGLGSVPGTILGTFVIGYLNTFSSVFLTPELATVITFGTIILVLIVRPGGLLGQPPE